jgi:GT2 family glycosyltransferase
LKVSALVSTYNSSKFITGCIDGLIAQSLYRKGVMEIIVIDSGSEEDEGRIVRELQKKHDRVKYLRTEHRETLYQAWNRGIREAEGEYLTSSNTDDRHETKCIELLTQALDENPNCSLSYGNLYKSLVPNEGYGEEEDSHPCKSQDFFPGSILLHYLYGAQPLWRKSLHQEVGFFNEKFKALGDYDFALRLAKEGITSKYVPEAWGKMLWHDEALSTRDFTALREKKIIIENHRNAETVFAAYQPMFSSSPALRQTEETLDECFLDLGLRSLCFYPQFSNQEAQMDLNMMKFAYSRKAEDSRFANNLLLHDLLVGKRRDPSDLYQEPKCDRITQANLRFWETGIGTGEFYLWGPSFDFPTESKLKGMEERYLFPQEGMAESGSRNIFAFCFEKFWNQMLKKIPQDELRTYERIYVWGANDKAILLSSWLKTQNLRFSLIDSNPSSQKTAVNGMTVLDSESLFTEAKGSRVAVILAMGSHYHSSLAGLIKTKLDDVGIFPL